MTYAPAVYVTASSRSASRRVEEAVKLGGATSRLASPELPLRGPPRKSSPPFLVFSPTRCTEHENTPGAPSVRRGFRAPFAATCFVTVYPSAARPRRTLCSAPYLPG